MGFGGLRRGLTRRARPFKIAALFMGELPPHVIKYLVKLGNPYAKLAFLADEEEPKDKTGNELKKQKKDETNECNITIKP